MPSSLDESKNSATTESESSTTNTHLGHASLFYSSCIKLLVFFLINKKFTVGASPAVFSAQKHIAPTQKPRAIDPEKIKAV